MPISVTLKPQTNIVTAVRTTKTAVSSISLTTPSLTLGQIVNVDATDPDEGETLVYDATINKYIVKKIQLTSNDIINIAGGTF